MSIDTRRLTHTSGLQEHGCAFTAGDDVCEDVRVNVHIADAGFGQLVTSCDVAPAGPEIADKETVIALLTELEDYLQVHY